MPDKSTQPRLDVTKISPDLYKAMASLEKYVDASGLEQKLLDLVKIRASQINGCAYCIAMHVAEARRLGEHDDRIHLLSVWREAPIYSARECAALTWTEAVTKLTNGEVADSAYETVRAQFTEAEIAALTYSIVAINGWNRLCIAFRMEPEISREVAAHAHA